MSGLRCGNCGATVIAKARYCPKCGATAEFFSREEVPSQTGPELAPVTKEVYKEKEVIREIVKIRCGHCGKLYDERENRCPYCGG